MTHSIARGGLGLIVKDGMSWARSRFPVEFLTPVEMAEADRLTAASVPGHVLMERAGMAVAEAVLRQLGAKPRRRVLILCGLGNNGGDGYVAARALADAGCDVTVAILGARADLRGDAAAAAARWSGAAIPLGEAAFNEADIVVDALFGAGLSRTIEGLARTAIEALNAWAAASKGPVVAVDIPSGIDGVSGQMRGIAVAATETVTFFRLKPGHVLMPGRLHCGAITLTDIGIDAGVLAAIRPETRLNVPLLWADHYPWPRLDGHKYARGHAVVVSGPLARTGAARLCARGALRAGAGLVTIATPAEALPAHAAALSAVMTSVCDGAPDLSAILEDRRKNALVLGPGLGVGTSTRALVFAALGAEAASGAPRRIVLDADALTSFADQPDVLFDAVGASDLVVAMTPHDGEFARLFGERLDLAQPKPQRARTAAVLSGAIVVLKGPDTVVAHPDGRAAIAASEAPWLATAGSGDVLAGMIAGLLAQPMPPFEAACAAVWLHAEAARLFGPGLVSEDIPEMLPKVLGTLATSDLIDET